MKYTVLRLIALQKCCQNILMSVLAMYATHKRKFLLLSYIFALIAYVSTTFKSTGKSIRMLTVHRRILLPCLKIQYGLFWMIRASGARLKCLKLGKVLPFFLPSPFPADDLLATCRNDFRALLILSFPAEGAHGPAPGPADSSACSGC